VRLPGNLDIEGLGGERMGVAALQGAFLSASTSVSTFWPNLYGISPRSVASLPGGSSDLEL
jgi:hypothetical protein